MFYTDGKLGNQNKRAIRRKLEQMEVGDLQAFFSQLKVKSIKGALAKSQQEIEEALENIEQ